MAETPDAPGISSTFYLILIQIFSRGVTFIGNQALLRYLSPNHLGLAVQLETLSISVLYTARESLRVALQRPSNGRSSEARHTRLQAAINASYLVPPLGLALGTVFGLWYVRQASEEVLVSKDFHVAFLLYCASTVIELASEPGFVVIQQLSLFRDRARAETLAAILRCVTACLAAVYMYRSGMSLSVLPFAVGQVAYACSLFLVYVWSAARNARAEAFSLFPARTKSLKMVMSMFSTDLLSLAAALYGQSVFKWLLTQGDVLVLSLFADLQSQGTFALASNYGGLASRLLFQPVEESSRTMFGNLLSTAAEPTQPASNPNNSTSPKQEHQLQTQTQRRRQQQQQSNNRQRALSYLSTTLRAYTVLIAIPSTTLLPHIFPLAVEALLGSKSSWSSTQTHALLAAYSYYIPFLALNGILDAFVTSVATERQLGVQSLLMLLITVAYLAAAYIGIAVVELGAVGLVYANILNMALRIAFSLWFVRAWTVANIDGGKLKNPSASSAFVLFCADSVPSGLCVVSAALVAVALHFQVFAREITTNVLGVSKWTDVRVGPIDLFKVSYFVSAGVVLLSSMIVAERDFLLSSLEVLLPQRVKSFLGPYLPIRAANTK